ncbi:uncharacterized protein [Euphorbia lathyris]|uniref:uncharacterized protein n=1 Tax=Euphorbia lathyris TaxID=212925 RepID=UPI00331359BD
MSITEEKIAGLVIWVDNIKGELAAISVQLAELTMKGNKSGSEPAGNVANIGPHFGGNYQDCVTSSLGKRKQKEVNGSHTSHRKCETHVEFRLPDMKKFDGTGDPTAHVNQYVAAMKHIILTEEQILGLFSAYLEGVALVWFHALPLGTKRDWKELAKAFITQYSFNTMFEVTLRELERTKQQAGESLSDFVSRWRAKAAVMKQKSSEHDQIRVVIGNTLPYVRNKLRCMPFTDFNQMYSYALTVEGDGESKRAYIKWTKSGYSTGGPSTNIEPTALKVLELNTIKKRHFTQFDQTYAKVFERLQKKELLKALTPKNKIGPTPQMITKGYCEFHSNYGHTIENCERLKHEIQDLIDKKKIVDPSSANPPPKCNPSPSHRVSAIGSGLEESFVVESFREFKEELLSSEDKLNVGNGLHVSVIGEGLTEEVINVKPKIYLKYHQ